MLLFLLSFILVFPAGFDSREVKEQTLSEGVTLADKTEQKKEVVLKNDKVFLKFDAKGQYLLREFITGGKNILPDRGSDTPLWKLTLLGPRGETPSITPAYSFYDGVEVFSEEDSSYAVAKWRILLDRKSEWEVNVRISLAKEDDMPRWSLSVGLPKGWVVTEVEFPTISVKAMEGSKAILPIAYGVEAPLSDNSAYEARYPSCVGTMQLLMAHDNNNTIYFSAEDKTGAGKWLKVRHEQGKLIFSQRVIASYSWSDGGLFRLPWKTAIAFNNGSWQETVEKWYRPFALSTRWGEKSVEEREIVKWVSEADMWLRPMGTSKETLEALNKALDFFGKGVGLHWYYWHNHDFDTNYPDYFPAKESFRDMVRLSQEKGARITPYINGRLWDSSTKSYKSEKGYKASCRKADGTLYTEVYSSKVPNTVTCPSSPIWRKVLRRVCENILEELGTDGVYMDQVAAARDEACYASNHPHSKGGGSWWPESYKKMTADFRRDVFGQDKAMTTEENAECYLDMFDMFLIVNSPHNSNRKMVPLFPLVYSDRCVYSGYTYIPWKINDGSMRFITMMSLLWGAQLGWAEPKALMAPENRAEAEFLRNLTVFRKKNRDLFFGGRFIGEFVPEGNNKKTFIPGYWETSEIMGAEWLDIQKKKSYIIVNMGKEDAEIIVPGGEKIKIDALSAKRIIL